MKCIAYPNRSQARHFKPRNVGNIVCNLLKRDASPETKKQLRAELERCFPCADNQSETEKRLRQAAAVAANALQETATVIAIALAVLLALFALVRVFPLLSRAALALIPGGARVAVTQIPGLLARLRARQAANDSIFRLLVGL